MDLEILAPVSLIRTFYRKKNLLLGTRQIDHRSETAIELVLMAVFRMFFSQAAVLT
jgi:hypothetical protein